MSSGTVNQQSAIDTTKVQDRRFLHFTSIDDVLDEANRLAASERRGALKQLGNWTIGQVFGHLATWAEYAFSPCPIKAPWFVRVFMGVQRKKFIYGPMKPGIRIPRVDGGTLGTGPMNLEEGLNRFRAAFEQLKRQSPTHPSPVFGIMTRVEAQEMNIRHAELHFGFFIPG